MNILIMCIRGDHRSVCMASILRNEKKQRDVITCGAYTFSQETLVMLYDWADKIIVVDPKVQESVHPEYRDKMVILDMGDDPWGPSFAPQFKDRAHELIKQLEL